MSPSNQISLPSEIVCARTVLPLAITVCIVVDLRKRLATTTKAQRRKLLCTRLSTFRLDFAPLHVHGDCHLIADDVAVLPVRQERVLIGNVLLKRIENRVKCARQKAGLLK